MKHLRPWFYGFLSILAVTSLSCTDNSAPLGPDLPRAATASLSPSDTTVFRGDTVRYTFRVFDQAGEPYAFGNEKDWRISPAGSGHFLSSGTFVVDEAGSITVTASVGEATRQANILSYPRPTGIYVAVGREHRRLAPGDTVRANVYVYDENGQDVADQVPVKWSVGDPAVLSVDSSGLVQAISPGTSSLAAQAGDVRGSVGFVVHPPAEDPYAARVHLAQESVQLEVGEVVEMEAQVLDQNEDLFDGELSWMSSDTTVASADAGRISGVAAGNAAVIASIGDVADTVSVQVLEDPPLATLIEITPERDTVRLDETLQLSAVVSDQYGDIMPGAPVEWASSASLVATVDSSGLVTPYLSGDVIVSATSNDAYAVAYLTVEEAPSKATSLLIVPQSLSLMEGDSADIRATVLDQHGDSLYAPESVTWSTADEAVASAGAGVLYAVAPGTTTLSAAADGFEANAEVVVSGGPQPSVIEVEPSALALEAGDQATVSATVRDTEGAELAIEPAWSTSDPSVATVAAGVVTAVAPGEAVVTATAGGAHAEVLVAVTEPRRVASVVVSPDSATLPLGGNAQFEATVTDQFGDPLEAAVTWSTSDSSVVQVGQDGLVSALSAGEARLLASVGGVTGGAIVRVEASTVAEIRLSPAEMELGVGNEETISASARDQAGNVVDAPIDWRSSDEDVATVAGGLVTALGRGTATITASNGAVEATATVTVRDSARLTTIIVTPTVTVLPMGGTSQLEAAALDQYGDMLEVEFVWASDNEAVASVADGLVSAHTEGTATISAEAEGTAGSATVNVTPVPALTLEEDTVEMSSIGAVVDIHGAVGESQATGMTFQLIAERRWLAPAAVAQVSGASVTATGAGTSTYEVEAQNGGAPDTLVVHVRLDSAHVASFAGPAEGEIAINGFHMDLLPSGSITIGGEPATVIGRDSASIRVATAVHDGTCSGAAVALLSIVDAGGLADYQHDAHRDGELALAVGESARIQGDCVMLPADGESEYALVYIDPRRTNRARSSYSSKEWDGHFNVTVTDESGPLATGAAPSSAASFRAGFAQPGPGPHEDPAATNASETGYSGGFLDRSTAWGVGDTFTYDEGSKFGAVEVVRVYGDRFVFAVPVDEVGTLSSSVLAAVDSAMAHIAARVEAPFLDGAFGDYDPQTGSTGQFLIVGRNHPNVGAVNYASGRAWEYWVEVQWGDNVTIDNMLYLVTHELAHSWSFSFRSDEARKGRPRAGVEIWFIEGVADLVAREAMRDYYGKGFADNTPLNGCAYYWCAMTAYSSGYLSWGYNDGADLMRDLLQRLTTHGGLSYEQALRAVGQGGSAGWFGCGDSGCAAIGLAEKMQQHLGTWDPIDGQFTYLFSKVADDRTPNAEYQNLSFEGAGSYFRSSGELAAGSGDSSSYEQYEGAGGYFLLTDSGTGSSFKLSDDVSAVEWGVVRLK